MDYFFSIIITTYNRKALLLQCLSSIQLQNSNIPFEVCIVNDGSTDGTELLLQQHTFSYPVSMISLNRSGPAQAKNIGAEESKGKYIVFMEDDVIAQSGWLQNAYEFLTDETIDVLEGKTIYQTTKKAVRSFDDNGYFSFIPCNLFIRRDLFLKTGGYDTSFNSVNENLYFREDTELGFRLMEFKIKIQKADNVVVEHPEQFNTMKSSFRHALRYRYDALLYKKHPRKFRKYLDVKKIFGLKLHRIHHYLYLLYIFICFLAAFLFLTHQNTAGYISIVILIMLAFIVRMKYQQKKAFRLYLLNETFGYFILPFVYFYGLVKGCLRYKSFGALL
ncbi:MAG: glycosyltransferase family 2 protein [Bacteroidetes bacterium]|nr:glycosyltransferase family 2 protein [Bacteroidota bacterium]